MNAADVMSRPVISVGPRTTVRAANALLVDHGFCALPVVNDDSHLVGIVSGADLLRAGVDRVAAGTTVAQVMRSPVISAPVSDDPAELAEIMLRDRLRCLPIVDDQQVLVGVVSRSDLLRTLVPDDDILASRVDRLLRAYSRQPRWTVHVSDGSVSVMGPYEDEAERRVVLALVHTVPGVLGIVLRDGREAENLAL